jgi:hypothetical protein
MKIFLMIALYVLCASAAQAKECPVYERPYCKPDERIFLDVVPGAGDCRKPTCGPVSTAEPDEEFQPYGCPSLVLPTCKEGEERVNKTDPNRCPYALCEPVG